MRRRMSSGPIRLPLTERMREHWHNPAAASGTTLTKRLTEIPELGSNVRRGAARASVPPGAVGSGLAINRKSQGRAYYVIAGR